MSTEDTALLARVPLFQGLSEDEQQVLAAGLEMERIPAGQPLIRYGDPSGSMYVLRAGRAEVFVMSDAGERIPLETVGPGDVIGEIALLTGGLRTASVQAIEDLEVLRLDRDDLERFLQSHPLSALDLLAVVGKRLQESNAQLRHGQARNVNDLFEDRRSTVERMADWVAAFSGSITFLNIQLVFFTFWILWNTLPRLRHFDPHPFEFLGVAVNLEGVLLATLVLISQKREGEKEHLRDEIEYEANLNSERSIAHLHVKVDELRSELLTLLTERNRSR